MASTYTTRDEAIQREIVDPILAGEVDSVDEYDVEAIASQVLGSFGDGFACVATHDEFWSIVQANAQTQKCRTCGEDVTVTRDESGGVEQTDGSGDVICDDCWGGRVA